MKKMRNRKNVKGQREKIDRIFQPHKTPAKQRPRPRQAPPKPGGQRRPQARCPPAQPASRPPCPQARHPPTQPASRPPCPPSPPPCPQARRPPTHPAAHPAHPAHKPDAHPAAHPFPRPGNKTIFQECRNMSIFYDWFPTLFPPRVFIRGLAAGCAITRGREGGPRANPFCREKPIRFEGDLRSRYWRGRMTFILDFLDFNSFFP